VATNEQLAAEADAEIQKLKGEYQRALRTLNDERDAGAAHLRQVELYRDFRDKGVAFFNCVESCIGNTEVLGAYRSDHWAKNLASTAVDVLDSIPRFYEKAWREGCRLGMPKLRPSPNAFFAMQSCVFRYDRDQVGELQRRFEELDLPVRGFTHPAKMNVMYERWEKIMMLATVIGFLAVLLAVGVFKTDYPPEGFFIIRVVLALVAAGFAAAFVPGLLQVVVGYKSAKIRAAGALAVLVVVYLLNPPSLVKAGRGHSSVGRSVSTNSSPVGRP